MNRSLFLSLAMLALAGVSVKADEDAMTLAQTITQDGATLFDTKNAAAMAATYTEDAEVVVTTRDSSGATKQESTRGRSAIERMYETLFKDAGTFRSKNTVEYARLIGPDILVIHGSFEPNQGQGALPFIQVRTKRDDKWLMSHLRLFIVAK